MTRDEQLFAQGMVVGAALAHYQLDGELAELTQRIRKLERSRQRQPQPQPQPRIRLLPAGWRDGRRTFFAAR